jgi:hypothetical protein
MSKPFAPAAERNQLAILEQLRVELDPARAPLKVLEIGSGTGQHACFFAQALPHVLWQPSELGDNIAGIELWLDEAGLSNVLAPLVLDVNAQPWPVTRADACFTCNTLHIVSTDSVAAIFKGARAVLGDAGKLCVYGPFKIDGKHTSPSNHDFSQWLVDSDPRQGVRDLTDLDRLAQGCGFSPSRRIDMPANNLFVVWDVAGDSVPCGAT